MEGWMKGGMEGGREGWRDGGGREFIEVELLIELKESSKPVILG